MSISDYGENAHKPQRKTWIHLKSELRIRSEEALVTMR